MRGVLIARQNFIFVIVNMSNQLVWVTIAYAVTSSISVFDIRLIQWRNQSEIGDTPYLPKWVALVHWADWGLLLYLIFLDWKYAIATYIIRFTLKVLPVLEFVGGLLMSPFTKRNKR